METSLTNDTNTLTAAPRVLVLVATIPARRKSCERLLAELTQQRRVPDGVVLVLDGYGCYDTDEPAPRCPLPIIATHRTASLSGAGRRWHAVRTLPPDDIIICLDDDIMLIEAPHLVSKLVQAVELGGAAAAMGRTADGKQAPPGAHSRGNLIYAAGCGLSARAGVLVDLGVFASGVQAAGGPDALGLLGDDDALVSAYLWQLGVKIHHAATGNIYAAPQTRTSSQTAARAAKQMTMDDQKAAIARTTGWPWPVVWKGANARA